MMPMITSKTPKAEIFNFQWISYQWENLDVHCNLIINLRATAGIFVEGAGVVVVLPAGAVEFVEGICWAKGGTQSSNILITYNIKWTKKW